MAAFVIVDQLGITDPDAMKEYSKGVGATVAKFGGEAIARDDGCEVLEGTYQPRRIIMLKFPDMEALKGWYDSEDYAELKAMRHRSSTANMYAVDGF